MPVKPARPCSQPGCPNLTHARFCEAHAKAEDERRAAEEREKEQEEQLRAARRTLAEVERQRLTSALDDASLLKRRRIEKSLARLDEELAELSA